MGSAKHMRNNGEEIKIHQHDNYQMAGTFKNMGDTNQNQPMKGYNDTQPGKVSGGAAQYIKDSYSAAKMKHSMGATKPDPDPDPDPSSKSSTFKPYSSESDLINRGGIGQEGSMVYDSGSAQSQSPGTNAYMQETGGNKELTPRARVAIKEFSQKEGQNYMSGYDDASKSTKNKILTMEKNSKKLNQNELRSAFASSLEAPNANISKPTGTFSGISAPVLKNPNDVGIEAPKPPKSPKQKKIAKAKNPTRKVKLGKNKGRRQTMRA